MDRRATEGNESPMWLRALGALVLALLAGSLAYAAWIGAVNFARIGV